MSVTVYDFENIDKKIDSTIKALETVRGSYHKDVLSLKSQIAIEPAKPIKALNISSVSIDTYKHGYYSSSLKIRVCISSSARDALKLRETAHFFDISEGGVEAANKFVLEKIAPSDVETHAQNIENAKSNLTSKTALIALIKSLGVGTSYYGYRTNRSSKKEEMSYNWPSEIGGFFNTMYNENFLESEKTKVLKRINDIYLAEKKKEDEKKKEEEKAKKIQLENKKMALLLAKYDLSLESSWGDILKAIISKDKYLRLAYWLEMNRKDWSDGCDYAEIGYNGFVVENTIDQEIADDIYSYIQNWYRHMDGRVFRDCKYNYSVLYGMSNTELLSDFQEVQSHLE